MRYLGSFVVLFLSAQAFTNPGGVVTRFSCTDSNSASVLVFVPDADQAFSFFDGHTLWNGQSVEALANSYYKVNVIRPDAMSGAEHMSAIRSVEFGLPSNRTISCYQSGGYYIPIFTCSPYTFTTTVTGKSADGQVVLEKDLNCVGH